MVIQWVRIGTYYPSPNKIERKYKDIYIDTRTHTQVSLVYSKNFDLWKLHLKALLLTCLTTSLHTIHPSTLVPGFILWMVSVEMRKCTWVYLSRLGTTFPFGTGTKAPLGTGTPSNSPTDTSLLDPPRLGQDKNMDHVDVGKTYIDGATDFVPVRARRREMVSKGEDHVKQVPYQTDIGTE